MIISNDDAIKRLNSPMNLINSMKDKNVRKSAMSLFIAPASPKIVAIKEIVKTFNPFIEDKTKEPLAVLQSVPEVIPQIPSVNDLIDNHDSQIKLGLAHDSALDLLARSVTLLGTKLDDVKADKLPAVIAATSKVVESIRKERNEAAKSGKDREVHYHFYTPAQKKLSDYEVIDVTA